MDEMNNFMIGKNITKIDEFNVELDELTDTSLDNLIHPEETLNIDLNELDT